MLFFFWSVLVHPLAFLVYLVLFSLFCFRYRFLVFSLLLVNYQVIVKKSSEQSKAFNSK